MKFDKRLRLSDFEFRALMRAPLLRPEDENAPRDLEIGGADRDGQICFEARRSERAEDEKRRKDHAKETVQNAG